MVKLILLLTTGLTVASARADFKSDLDNRINCRAMGTRTMPKPQAFVMEGIVGGNTRIELKRQKFKHLSQFELFLGELQQLMLIRKSARGGATAGDELVYETVAVFTEYLKENKFLDPLKVCRCAYDQASKSPSPQNPNAVNTSDKPKWFAGCIAEQFVPTMYNSSDLEDRYD